MSEHGIIPLDRLAGVETRLSALMTKARSIVKEAEQIANELGELIIEIIPDDPNELAQQTLKRRDGRLTEAGVRALNALFASGVGVVEAAGRLRISPSAASSRYTVWRASRPAPAATSKPAPEVTPETAPEATSDSTMQAAPAAKPEPAPEVSPEPALEATPAVKPRRRRQKEN